LRTIAVILLCLLCLSSTYAQYYLRGEVRDDKNNALANAKILLHSNGYVYHSGYTGAFGIVVPASTDSVTISLDGYSTVSKRVEAGKYETIQLKMLYVASLTGKNRLLSFTKNLKLEDRPNRTVANETYSSLYENDFISAGKYSETGFAIHTDKASYSNIRRFLTMNTRVPPDAVRVEEMLNYFDLGYAQPEKDSVFGFDSYISDCPWNEQSQLLFLQVSARKIDPEKIPPSNLVFLIDVSGSMDMPNRLPLLKSSFKLLVDNLREKDTISIVVYGSTIGVWLPPTCGKEKEKIRKAIEDLTPGGATPGESGIRSAYRLAKSKFIAQGNNRVILATDGDFNIGQTSEDELENLITQHQQSGIYLTCLGVGMGNYKDSKLEVLSKKGNGNFAYLDNEKEAEKVLVKELTQTLYTVADDAYLTMEFNPKIVKEYRLIGYDNKVKALTDTASRVEGGEIGSGHSMMVLFEIVPVNSFQNQFGEETGNVTVYYRLPTNPTSRITSYRCLYAPIEFEQLPETYRFASSVTMFAGLLRDSRFMKRVNWADVSRTAISSLDYNDAVQKEFVTLVSRAKKIYRKRKRS
jgi:Ca-activated chloride channel homolog